MVLPSFLVKDRYCIQDVLLEQSSFLSLFLLYMNAYVNMYKSMHTVVSWWSRSQCSSRIVRAAVLGIRAQPTQCCEFFFLVTYSHVPGVGNQRQPAAWVHLGPSAPCTVSMGPLVRQYERPAPLKSQAVA